MILKFLWNNTQECVALCQKKSIFVLISMPTEGERNKNDDPTLLEYKES